MEHLSRPPHADAFSDTLGNLPTGSCPDYLSVSVSLPYSKGKERDLFVYLRHKFAHVAIQAAA